MQCRFWNCLLNAAASNSLYIDLIRKEVEICRQLINLSVMDVPQSQKNQHLQLYNGAITLLSESNIHQEGLLKNAEFVLEFIRLLLRNLTQHFEKSLVFV